jgi:hypothetical protein
MNTQRISKLQREYGLDEMQGLINSGQVWKFEGAYGRAAMNDLERGACMLPKEMRIDYYGNEVPSRDVLEKGSKGTYHNCKRFWEGVENGDIEVYDY